MNDRRSLRLGSLLLAVSVGRLASQAVPAVWTATPAHPTVGDTIVVSRTVESPAGWRVRAGKFEPTEAVDALAEAAVRQDSAGWDVEYFLVAWSAGPQVVAIPPVWRLGPDGTTDSLPGGEVSLDVRSVLPAGDPHPTPQPALAPIQRPWRRPWAPVAAGLLAVALVASGTAWRRRAPRRLPPVPGPPRTRGVPDATWLSAGEPKAVAARATGELRAALAQLDPSASAALSTRECLTLLDTRLSRRTLEELSDVLSQLDRVAFASAHGSDVGALAGRARALAQGLRS
jgi:hypothetical protein